MDWQAWWITHQTIDTADPADCHEWVSARAVQQFRANEAERESLARLALDAKHEKRAR